MAKVKVPKRVGGVKIPKKVRRKAKKAIRMAESPVVREFATAALGAAAQARAGKAGSGNGGGRAVGASVEIDGAKLRDAIRAAAADGIRRFLEGFEQGLRQAAAPDADTRPAGKGASRRSDDAPGAA